MAKRIVIDPVTRIEGHHRVEVEIEGGKVKDAWSTATFFRGLEVILKDRDPRDAWQITQRICGICPTPHAYASVLSMDDAFGIEAPTAGRILRNLSLGANFVHSHILHFYHLAALDYVDIISALDADPVKTGELAQALETKVMDFKAVKDKLAAFAQSGQLGIFANGFWGHPAYKLSPEVNLLAVAHYLDAFTMQAKASEVNALIVGRAPIGQGWTAGGITTTPTVALIAELKYRIMELQGWVDGTYLPDILAIAPFYIDWAAIGGGYGNFLSWGVFPDESNEPTKQLLPRGAVLGGKITGVKDVKADEVKEFVKHSWYTDTCDDLNPGEGKTEAKHTKLDTAGRYSWIKAPRVSGKPMEVGPLARMVVAYGRGDKVATELIDSTLEKLGVPGKPEVLVSTLGRHAARLLECKKVVDAMADWIEELVAAVKKGEASTYKSYDIPSSASGVGLTEAPRGSLAHWNEISGKKIKNYQVVAPTTWNFGPRDDKDNRGPLEEALIGTPVEDPTKPIEILRVVRSFDP